MCMRFQSGGLDAAEKPSSDIFTQEKSTWTDTQVIEIISTGSLENWLKHACNQTLNTQNFPL